MKSRITKLLTVPMVAGILIAYSSCGGTKDNKKSSTTDDQNDPQEEEDRQQSQGTFSGNVVVINQTIIQKITTINRFIINNDDVDININVDIDVNDPRPIPPHHHRQCIHEKPRCPTIADDRNHDGYVDGVEARNSVGGVLIPLDDDIDSQNEQDYPSSNTAGRYQYEQNGSFNQLLQDLHEPDEDPNDEFVKLGPDENLDLENRVVVIYGLAEDEFLPPTVQGLPGRTPHESFPVGCGPIRQTRGGSSTGGTTGGTTGGGTTGGTSGGSSGGTSGGTSGGSTFGGSSGGDNGGE